MLLLMRRPGEAIVADGKLLRVKAVTPTHVEFEVAPLPMGKPIVGGGLPVKSKPPSL